MFRTLCSRLKGNCKYMELEQQPQCLIHIFTQICVSVFILSSCHRTLLHSFLFCSLWEGLGMRVLSFLVQTVFHRRWLVRFADASCVVSQHRSFFNMLRGDLVPVSVLRDHLCSKVSSNITEQTIDNCDGTKQVQNQPVLMWSIPLSAILSRCKKKSPVATLWCFMTLY